VWGGALRATSSDVARSHGSDDDVNGPRELTIATVDCWAGVADRSFWLRDVSTPLHDPLTRAAVVPSSDSLTGELALKIENLLAGVQSQAWAVLLRD
jgi:hypothetical protein